MTAVACDRVFDLSKKQWGDRTPKARDSRRTGEEGRGGWGSGYAPFPENFRFFSFQNSAFWCIFDDFSYTKSKVLFAIKRKERYVITAFLAIDGDTDIKRQVFINFVNLSQ